MLEEVEILKIEEIETSQSFTTYDFEVDKNHNYFANGILTHNSEHVPMLFMDEIMILKDFF